MAVGTMFDRKYGFVVWFAVTLYVVFAFCLNTATAVFSEPIQQALKLSAQQATAAVGAYIIGFALMQIPAGALLDKFNNKLIICSAVAVLSFGCLMVSFSTNLPTFALANFIMGMGGAFAFIAAGKAISRWFAPAAFPVMFGLTQTVSCSLSGFIHNALSQQLKTHSWSSVYVGLAVVGATILAVTLVFFKDPKTDKLQPGGAGPEVPSSLLASVMAVIRIPQIWLCAFAAALSFGALLAYAGFWYVNIGKYYSVSQPEILLEATLVFIGVGVGSLFWGVLSNYFKPITTLIHSTLVVGTVFMLSAIYMPHFEVDTQLVAQATSFCIGFFLSGSMLFYTVAANIVPARLTGVALSVVNTVVFVVNTILLSLPYQFSTKTAVFFNLLWLFPVSVLIAIGLVVYMKNTKQEA